MATIRKRNGRYHTQVRKNGISTTKSFTNKLDAQKWAKVQEVKIEQGTYTTIKKEDEVVTLAFLLARWEKEVLTSLKSWSVERYKVALVSKALGNLTLDKVTSTLLASYRDKRLTEVSNQTVKHELGLVRRALKKGIEWGYTSIVPYVASPSLKGQARTRRLTEKELNFQDSLVLTILIALLVYDLVLYWQHRLFHRIQFFWRFHRIHHSDLELDISTSVRQHPVSSLFSNMITGSLLVLSGISYEAFILCILCSQLYSFFTHANIKLNTHLESVMSLIFITPKTHTVHHLANLPYTDSNYGEIFSVWDKLFNSYRQYPGMDAHNYLLGLDSIREKQDQSVIKLLLNPFKH